MAHPWPTHKRNMEVLQFCGFIRKTGTRLKLQLATTCTAQVLFHRFVFRQPTAAQQQQQHNLLNVAMACIFLASKVEEDVVSAELVLAASKEVLGLIPSKENLSIQQHNIVLYERIILNTLNYQVMVEHPFDSAQSFVKLLTAGSNAEDKEALSICVRSILNDSFSTPMCLTRAPRQIAAAAVCLACQLLSKATGAPSGAPPKRYLEVLNSFERRNDVFGFSLVDLRPVQEELVSFYEKIV